MASPHSRIQSISQNTVGSENTGTIVTGKKICYIHSDELLEICDRLPRFRERASLVHSLIKAYNLLENISVIPPLITSEEVLKGFHSTEYVSCLKKVEDVLCDMYDENNNYDEHLNIVSEVSNSDHGLGYDCPIFPEIYTAVSLIAKSTITAAEVLADRKFDVAVNFFGGWHHAHMDEAAGFCYVNDIVLGILKLREKFTRVLYLDLDVHHGDGVEEAFFYTNKVMTVSFHKVESGFFPGTGSVVDIGKGSGKYFTVNVPLRDGTTDREFSAMFKSVLSKVKEKFNPEVVVCQCGADVLSGDPMGAFNLTSRGITDCIADLLSYKLPLLILGGGGYNFPNTARCWTEVLGCLVGAKLEDDIPEHENFNQYGPSYDLGIYPGTKRSCNTLEYLSGLLKEITNNLNNVTIRKPLEKSNNTTNNRKRSISAKKTAGMKYKKLLADNSENENIPL